MKAVDAVPALFTTYAYYNSDKFGFYGEELMRRCMAFRTLLDAGIRAAPGSDFSPGPYAPLMGIQGMVTRTGWNGETWGANQRVSLEEAVRINTLNGAYNSHEEGLKRSITPDKLADFVVLAEDPSTVDPETIKDIEIVRTVVGGTTVYEVGPCHCAWRARSQSMHVRSRRSYIDPIGLARPGEACTSIRVLGINGPTHGFRGRAGLQ